MNNIAKWIGYPFLILNLVVLAACSEQKSLTANSLIDKTIEAHQAERLYGKEVHFRFRDREYSLFRNNNYYRYQRFTSSETDTMVDVLHSEKGFKRMINGEQVQVVDSMATKYSSSVNSVLYFFQLPLVLKDPAVQAEYIGTTDIGNTEYHSLKITFKKEGGGKDFEDEFRYWINSETLEIDFLAYSYLTDGGGVRFREAFNKNRLNGVLCQDYRNFKPKSKETPLDSLPDLFENNELELLSTIENTNIIIGEAGEI